MDELYIKYKKYLIFLNAAIRVFGILCGALSIMSFIKDTYDLGLSYTIRNILDQFNDHLDRLFDRFEPVLNWLLEKIRPDLSLQDGWENIMVLCLLYYLRDGLSFFYKNNGRQDRRAVR